MPEAKGSDLCRPQNAQHLEMFGQDENVSVISCWQTIFPNRFPQLPGLAARGAFSVSPSADTSRAQRDEIKTAGPGRPRHSQTDGNWCCEPLGKSPNWTWRLEFHGFFQSSRSGLQAPTGLGHCGLKLALPYHMCRGEKEVTTGGAMENDARVKLHDLWSHKGEW